jgi:hypothetical protein
METLNNMKKKKIFFILKVTEDFGTDPDPHPDPLVRGTDPRIRIRIRAKMSRIRITEKNIGSFNFCSSHLLENFC